MFSAQAKGRREEEAKGDKLAGDVACLGGSMVEHRPRLLGFRVRFPAGALVFFPFLPKLHFQFCCLLCLPVLFPLPSTFRLRFKRIHPIDDLFSLLTLHPQTRKLTKRRVQKIFFLGPILQNAFSTETEVHSQT